MQSSTAGRAADHTPAGYFGEFGGMFVPEVLVQPLLELEAAYQQARADASFQAAIEDLRRHYLGRPTPLYFAAKLSAGGPRIYFKREDLAHTGAHKINNAIGQALLAQRLGKRRLIAETGAGQHGVATATVAAKLGLECTVYMGAVDIERQKPNVLWMRLLGAEVRPVESGSQTLKDAINETLRDWAATYQHTHYLLGSVLGPHPFPTMVRDFQSIIGREARAQVLEAEGRLPTHLVACVGGGSNSIGLFHAFRDDPVQFIGVEAGGLGVDSGHHAARFATAEGRPGILQGAKTYVLSDADGQILSTHSVSAGLDYPAVGPEHSYLRAIGRATYTSATDEEALEAFRRTCRAEGIIAALESSHAIAHALKLAKQLPPADLLLVNLSGRGDKDIFNIAKALNVDLSQVSSWAG
ncbi:MAG: tryptophan synthase subunit beta [Chloroflexota bacterium]|nr:tryptophan synthase subunit beta [Chloroflexota bacterium]